MKKDLECIEVKCIAKGNTVCEFLVGTKDKLYEKYPDICKKQLG